MPILLIPLQIFQKHNSFYSMILKYQYLKEFLGFGNGIKQWYFPPRLRVVIE